MKSFLFSLFLTVQLFNCNAEVCLPTWSPLPGSYSSNGDLLESVTVLQDCLAQCERRGGCLAVDFNTSQGIVSCGLHYEASDLTGANLHTSNNITQYRITRSCDDFTEACPVKWTLTPSVRSANGRQYSYWTEYDCFTFCRYTPNCVAVDFDNSTNPPCWVHTNLSDVSAANSKYSASSVRYSLNKTCSSSQNLSQMELGRCAGQWFPSTGWCPPCYEVSIKGANYNVNPLCCYLNADDAQPPGAQWLQSFSIRYFNATYYQQILSCNGSSDDCSLASGGYSNSIIRNDYCPEKGSSATNFVSISYACIATGTTCEPSTTIAAKPTPVLSSTSRSSSSLVPSGVPENAPMMSTKNNNPLIIGLVVGLGVPLLLAIIIVIIIFAVRRKKQSKLKLHSNEKPDAFYYTVGTVPRGDSHENHVDEISMNIDKPVNEF